ncbi:MAG: IS3 family transposase [Eggerthellaceae bacterium]|nr:IS3 family transposase [Eggerthellaceae bacterium]
MESKKALVDGENPDTTVKRQCELLGVPRSSYYAEAKPEGFTEEEERAMRIMDAAHAENSYYGARSHMNNLARNGVRFGRHHVARLMEHMGTRSTAPQPKTSAPAKSHPEIPHLLRGLPVRHPNRVRATDITYVPLGRGHVCLSAIIDPFSRFVVGWRLHDAIEAAEAVICMEATVERRGCPAMSNSDQGSTYTAQCYIDCLARHDIRQSIDGARRWADSAYIERRFRDLKHDCIYQTEHRNMRGLRHVIAEYAEKYNFRRVHSSLDYATPAEWYFSGLNAVDFPEDKGMSLAA